MLPRSLAFLTFLTPLVCLAAFHSTSASKDTLLLLLGVDHPLHVAHQGALDGIKVICESLQQLHLVLPQLREFPLLAPQDAHQLILELWCHLYVESTSIHF